MSVKELSFSGSHYDVGKALGLATRKEVNHILGVFQRSALYCRLQEFLKSNDGLKVLDSFLKITEKHCAPMVSELRGIADGANLDYNELFLLNLEPEWVALFGNVPYSEHGIQYASTFESCTDIHLPTEDSGQVFLAHTEDISPEVKDSGFLVTHRIYRTGSTDETEPEECFTEYILPGILPGSKFGFNKHGLMYGNNNIFQKGVNLSGIPRRFVFRSVITARNVEEANKIVKNLPGIATAANFNLLYKEHVNGADKVVNCCFEIAGDRDTGAETRIFYPSGVYHHCNTFQHLTDYCHPEESSLHRAAVLKQLIARGQLSTHTDLLKALCNQEDRDYPIFRTGSSPDHLCTAATAVFDSSTMKLTVYGDKPDACPGQEIDVMKFQ